MKDFLKYTLATVLGIFIFMLVMGFLAVMSIAGMLASSDTTTNVKDNTVLVLNLKGAMEERAASDLMTMLSGDVSGPTGLDDMLNAINKAKDNDNIKGIYIEAGMFSARLATPRCRPSAALCRLQEEQANGWWPTATSIPSRPTTLPAWPTRCG